MATDRRSPAGRAIPRPQQIDLPSFEIGPDDTVVDVGCGEGDVCVYAGHQGASVVGIDIEPSLVERASEAMRPVPARSFRGLVSDADPIPLPDACASVIIATEVLEHVDDPARFVSELARIGKPDARYLISVPDPVSESVMRTVAPAWYWRKPLHVRVFDHGELEALLTAAGLAVVERHVGGFSSSLHWFFRMAVGMVRPHEPMPDHPIFPAWDETMRALLSCPRGPTVLRELDRLIPKSQIAIARKPAHVGATSSLRGPTWPKGRLRRLLRDGGLRLGGFDISWRVRKAAPVAAQDPGRASGAIQPPAP